MTCPLTCRAERRHSHFALFKTRWISFSGQVFESTVALKIDFLFLIYGNIIFVYLRFFFYLDENLRKNLDDYQLDTYSQMMTQVTFSVFEDGRN